MVVRVRTLFGNPYKALKIRKRRFKRVVQWFSCQRSGSVARFAPALGGAPLRTTH